MPEHSEAPVKPDQTRDSGSDRPERRDKTERERSKWADEQPSETFRIPRV